MTVRDLIEKLKDYDPDLQVITEPPVHTEIFYEGEKIYFDTVDLVYLRKNAVVIDDDHGRVELPEAVWLL